MQNAPEYWILCGQYIPPYGTNTRIYDLYFYNPWKKTIRFFTVFRGYRNVVSILPYSVHIKEYTDEIKARTVKYGKVLDTFVKYF